MEKSFKVPTNVSHEKNKPPFELFQREKAFDGQERCSNSWFNNHNLPLFLPSFRTSTPPPLSPTVDRILEDRRGCGVTQTTVPFLNPGSEHRLDMSQGEGRRFKLEERAKVWPDWSHFPITGNKSVLILGQVKPSCLPEILSEGREGKSNRTSDVSDRGKTK